MSPPCCEKKAMNSRTDAESALARVPRGRRGSRLSLDLVESVVAIIEATIIATISLVAAMIFVDRFDDRVVGYLTVTVLSTLAVVTAFYLSNLYSLPVLSMPRANLKRVFAVFGGLLLIVTSIFFTLKVSAEFSRAWLLSWIIVASCVVAVFRMSLGWQLGKWAKSGVLNREVIILGAGERGRELLREINTNGIPQIRVIGFFDDRVNRYGDVIDGLPLLGRVSDLVEYLRDNPAAEIMITLPWSAADRIRRITNKLRMLPVDVHLIPELLATDFHKVTFGKLGDVPILQVSRRPIAGWRFIFKSFEDRVLGGFLTLVAAPIMLFIAIGIKLTSPGPVLFRQVRHGFNNRLINVYKFRTMYTHLTDANAERLTAPDDERITPFGKFLRKTSLDELPQLLNVIQGEMSLVGPRPHATQAKAADRLYQDVADEYAARHRVKPGITGWAQVNGWRGETDTYEKLIKRVEYDLYYIDNCSLWMDLKILFMTIVVCIQGSNAY